MNGFQNHRYDLTVIGAGVAGMAAAAFAANRGLSTAIVGLLGETWLTSGLVDAMGIHPIETGNVWLNPWAAMDSVRRDIPGHPYACLSNEEIKTALREFYSLLEAEGLAYCCEEERNSQLITALGSVKTTHGVPRTMWQGVAALQRKPPCLIVDIQGLRGFSARLIAERLKSRWPGLKPLSISAYEDQGHEIDPVPLAIDLELEEHRERLADRIRPNASDVEFVGLPAILGINRSDRIARDLEQRLGRPVFEIPAMPPSVPGIRLRETLVRILAKKGVRCLFQKKVLRMKHFPESGFLLDIGKSNPEAQIASKGAVLATGRFLGGGLRANLGGIQESLLGLPICQPDERERWHAAGFFDPAGHAINQSGLETDRMFRPLDGNRHPAFQNLFAAGTILSHQDWMRMKCGSGLSIATAYGAVQSFHNSRP